MWFFKPARRSTGTKWTHSDLFSFKSELCLSSEASANPGQSSVKAKQSSQTELKGTLQFEFGQSYTNAPHGDKSSPPTQYAALKTQN